MSRKSSPTPLSLPKTMDVFGLRYDIVMRDDLENDNSAAGLVKFKACQVLIESSLSYDMAVSTLIHEIIEIANDSLELRLEHRTICGLEVAVYQALKSGNLIE